ncbi:Tetratricopeptide repeat 37 [Paramuricea clavata]|uniref:Tetratricopeptide repeat 37 n=1 Tax=Paramuricea clavata TaxID=317549 RepID=A0A6S7J6T3_PARCT|nr:Tetratricopeptide repeat 37 [Paramuricea clavata]
MHGVLLEHQELYSQAEKAYHRSLQLLECSENSDNECGDIVRANYARVLCSLGKYSESIKMYQEINPLNNFHHITGLALAFFMFGNLEQSYQVYEQAFELATNEGQKSHVRAAMGILGYILGDVDRCKFALCESSELRPASEQGLLALTTMGLITSDITLAAAALSELVKIGQKGDEHLISEASYLFASFYALQGSPDIGKSYIVQEIHRRPHSSLLWNNLAKFILRFQPHELKAAARCAEAAHRLGDRNVEDVSTTYAYSTIGCGHDPACGKPASNKISPGVVSAQKALHMNPDCLTNWTLLSAALSDASTCYTSAPQKSKLQLCEMVTRVSLARVIEASNCPLTRPEVFERRNLNITEASQKWLALQYGYCLYYSGKTDEAIQHC